MMATNEWRSATMKRKRRAEGPRAELMREWRGCDEVAHPDDGVHSPAEFITAILRAAGVEDGLNEEQVRSAWKELAGDFIAGHTEPVSVRNGHLVLRVTQPAMRFHLEQMKPMLLTRIRGQLGQSGIQSIKFTLG